MDLVKGLFVLPATSIIEISQISCNVNKNVLCQIVSPKINLAQIVHFWCLPHRKLST